MLVDHHAHWLPEPVLERLSRRRDPPMAWREGGPGGPWVFQAALRPRPLGRSAHALADRASQLRHLGIGAQVLSWSPLWNLESLPAAEALAVARDFNDATAAVVSAAADDPGVRYRGLAVAPVGDMDAAVVELQRAASTGLEGFVLPAWLLANAAEADAATPLFELAGRLGLRVFVHPGRLPAGMAGPGRPERLERHWHRHLGLAPQHEIGHAMMTLCQEGWLAAFPGVAVQFANGGGSFVAALERLQRMPEDDARTAARRHELLQRVTVDSASLGPVGIAAARALLGTPAVVFGSDAPIFDAARAADDWWLAAAAGRPAAARETAGAAQP
jgi:predicted TIM-barrel fold metal-dependent hydrolase